MSRAFNRALLLSLAVFPLASTAVAQVCNPAGRTIQLILDASGSMNAMLPGGETRIDVARRAVKDVASLVPADAQLALRLYGSQSPRAEKNCQDAHLALPFGPAGSQSGAIGSTVDSLVAQGYTPIAFSLDQARADFPADATERVIVLVSDGKETCAGDPCAMAKALGAEGYTIHTIGFVVDSATRMQLQCMARASGGSYFDAPSGPELPGLLKDAFNTCKKTVVKLPAKPMPGALRTTSATWLTSHAVLNTETGEMVGEFNSSRLEMVLPAGIYEVKFGPASWKGIEVRPGETTTIDPGVLEVEVSNPSVHVSAAVVDSETGEEQEISTP